jgi:hypothetical protein
MNLKAQVDTISKLSYFPRHDTRLVYQIPLATPTQLAIWVPFKSGSALPAENLTPQTIVADAKTILDPMAQLAQVDG